MNQRFQPKALSLFSSEFKNLTVSSQLFLRAQCYITTTLQFHLETLVTLMEDSWASSARRRLRGDL